jgi:hypothetical protein
MSGKTHDLGVWTTLALIRKRRRCRGVRAVEIQRTAARFVDFAGAQSTIQQKRERPFKGEQWTRSSCSSPPSSSASRSILGKQALARDAGRPRK